MIEEPIFHAALERLDPADRAAYLDSACGGDADLRRRVEELLRVHDQTGGLLADVPEGLAPAGTPPIAEAPGDRIGPYRLRERIGEGGMGVVYLAEQEAPVRRTVALKVIKPGMDTEQVVARFEQERQALALMDHPNIARVLDAGATATGRPYFVMELVKGAPITEYCDAIHLTPRERLELFVPVCRAIQHAHQKGIIHRDIKPGNVLIAMVDGKPVPKVIDFGVAKAIDQRLTERSLFTHHGSIVGTLEYMSPEQAELSALDVDTRTDVYALGVLLYELLTGTTPLDRARLREAGYAEILRRIREEEPPPPSTRLSGSRERLPSVAAFRRTEPARLPRLVRGDLDWIAMKALEKDRSRRYPTADALGRDVGRHLDGDPVEAGPPSRAYRLRKFARKHRTPLATVVAVAALLATAAAFYALEARRARQAERLSGRRLDEVRHANRATAAALADTRKAQAATLEALKASEAAREEAERVKTFLVETFRSPDPRESGRDVKVADVLDRATEELKEGLSGSPVTKGNLFEAIGQTYLGLGLFDASLRAFERAYAVRRAALGTRHLDTLTSMRLIANAEWLLGRVPEAVLRLEEVLRIDREVLGPRHKETLLCMNDLAAAYRSAGRMSDALPLFVRSFELARETLGAAASDTIAMRNNLASTYFSLGRHAEARPLFEEALAASRRVAGPKDPRTLQILHNIAANDLMSGRASRAATQFEEVLRLRRDVLGRDHPDTLSTLVELASTHTRSGNLREAIARGEEALAATGARLGPDDVRTRNALENLSVAYQDAGEFEKAGALFDLALARNRETLGGDDPRTLSTAAALGLNLVKRQKWSEAEPVLREALAAREKAQPDAWTTFNTRSLLGGALLGQGRFAEAEPLIVAGYDGMKAREATIPPQGRARLAEAAARVVALYAAWGRPERAAAWRAKLGRPPAELPADVFARP